MRYPLCFVHVLVPMPLAPGGAIRGRENGTEVVGQLDTESHSIVLANGVEISCTAARWKRLAPAPKK